MKHTVTSTDLIDHLVVQAFGCTPDVVASLARDDEEVRLRLLPGMTVTTNPLDGVEVFMRHVLAACVAMRLSTHAVSLSTERQARAAGWPNARMANMVVVLAWGYLVGADLAGSAVPILVEADDALTGRAGPLVPIGQDLASYGELLAALYDTVSLNAVEVERDRIAKAGEERLPGARRPVGLGDLVQELFGVDIAVVELPSDGYGDRSRSGTARAAAYLACIVAEALRTGQVLQDERISAVRIKSQDDARLAGYPGLVAADASLLLGVAVGHGAGLTAHLLPARTDYAAALVEASQRIQGRHGRQDDIETRVVERLELEDLAARGYVHVGRDAARSVAQRLSDAMTGSTAQAVPSADGTAP